MEEVPEKESFKSLFSSGFFQGTPNMIEIIGVAASSDGKIAENCKGCDSKKTGLFSIYCTIFIINPFCIFCFLLCNLIITGVENDVIFAPLSSCQKSTYVGVLVYHLASTSHNGFFTASI